MDASLQFCLLKFAEDQELIHDNERKALEQIHQNHVLEIKNQQQKTLREQKMILELFEKQLVSNRQQLDLSKTELVSEITLLLQRRLDSEQHYVEQIIRLKENELTLWLEEQQLKKSSISEETELSNFNQQFETEKRNKMIQLDEFYQAKHEQILAGRTLLNDHTQELIQEIEDKFNDLFSTSAMDSSYNHSDWLANIQMWFDEKFQLEKSPEKLGSEITGTESINILSQYWSSGDSIQHISATILDTNAHKQELIAEFKQKIEKIFNDEEIEYNKTIDKQIQQMDQEYLTLNITSGRPAETETEVETLALLGVEQYPIIATQSSSIASFERIKRLYSERLKEDREVIIAVLESSDTDNIPDGIRQWLEKQSDERRRRFEKYQQIHEEKQAQHLAADQAQIIELACALNQLAINSENADEFMNKLKNEEKRVLEKHQELKALRKRITVPVIVQQIYDLTDHELPVCIRFNEDFDQWMEDADNKKLRLILSIQAQFNLSDNDFEINGIKRGSVVVYVHVKPPNGQRVYQQLMADGLSDVGGFDTISVTLGELDLSIKQEKMNEQYNRNYGNYFGGTHWTRSFNRGGKPYFCPKGWRRFGIKVAPNKQEFDQRWGAWHIAYHGTAHENAATILKKGLKIGRGCYTKKRIVYLSPSINYAAHYRYSNPWKNPQHPGKYYQMVLQCRVNPQIVTADKIKPQSLECPQTVRIDENFSNNELEWIIDPTNDGDEYVTDNIICYGIMIRVCDRDPYELPESRWWQHTGAYLRDYV